MDFQPLIDGVHNIYAQYPLYCYLAAGALFLLTVWKPAKMLKRALLLLVLLVVVYICFFLIDSMFSGVDVKQKAIHRTESKIED